MKKVFVLLFTIVLLLLSGCGNPQTVSTGQIDDASQNLPDSSQNLLTLQTSSEKDTSSENLNTGDVINITEKMYVTYINDIYTNAPDYLGKTIQIEGMFASEYYEPKNATYYYVYRTGPGCCGNDGSMCGFEFSYNGKLPENNDWIQVVGTLYSYEEEGNQYLALKAQTVTVMEERGAEAVYR